MKDHILTALEPQINLSRSTRWRMWLLNICVFAVILQSSLTDGFHSLYAAFAALAAALGTEFLVNIRNKTMTLLDGSAAATALILTLLLPNTLPPLIPALGAAFAVAVVKHSFGGLGSNWLNPALGGWLFIRFSFGFLFSQNLEGSALSILSGALSRGYVDPAGSPMGIIKLAGYGAGTFDGMLTGLLNSTVFSFFRATLPEGYVQLFCFDGPALIADRGLFALASATVLITAAQISRFWMPAVYLAVYGLLIRLFGALPYGGFSGGGDVLFGLCTGGTLVAAFILLADPATGPKSTAGAAAVSVLAALFSFIFRYPGGEVYGAFFAVALVNALVPLIRGAENRFFFEKRRSADER
ncbi:MAG: RnfABCDGE type electron transport complex subunit D [Spirochaetaceae bacterium]|nr:RnfABCDGE type electron transport complex subunit D [Spirochaetaceae bacterium]